MQVAETNNLLPVGSLLRDTYVIDGYLASGGFGNTYLVHHKVFEERKAIKEFYLRGLMSRGEDRGSVYVNNQSDLDQVTEYLNGFMDEARRMHMLNNRNIVRVYDIFEENNTAYYVMDYIDGKSLSEILKERQAPLEVGEVKSVLSQMLDALDEIHRKGLWHLDIKPSNIMLDRDGNAILIDFGTSKQIDLSTGKQITSAVAAYTPGFAPSEQQDYNNKLIGAWTDLYALGATIYNLLTNSDPPTGSEISNYGVSAFHFLDGTDDTLKDLTIWMMNPHISTRPRTVAEIRDFLSHAAKVAQAAETPTAASAAAEQLLASKDEDETYPLRYYDAPKSDSPRQYDKTEIGKSRSSSNKKGILIAVLAFLVSLVASVGVIYYLKSSKGTRPSKDSSEKTEKAEKADTVMVENKEITVKEGGNSVTYTYSGPMVDGLPNGKGVAIYSKGGVETRYEGPFVDGVREGENGTLTYTQGEYKGDVYEGAFHEGAFNGECVYKENTGSVFRGVAKDGRMYDGYWYDGNVATYQIVKGKKK